MNSDLTLSNLRDRGFKITNVRKQLINTFSNTNEPLSARDIYNEFKLKGINVNKTTIYRELQFMIKENLLIEVHLNPQETSYESAELMHHHHLICEVCGKIDNITNCIANNLEGDVLKKKGFKIIRHSLEFYGTCNKCMKRA